MAVRRVNTGKKVEMQWDCPYCDTKKILARHKSCPNCGRSRMGGTYLGDNPTERILSEEDKKLFSGQPDWYCDYCDTMNPSTLDTCRNCGSPKGESKKDYFDRKKEQIQKGELPKEDNVVFPKDATNRFFEKEIESNKEDVSYESSNHSSFTEDYNHKTTYSWDEPKKNFNFSSINFKAILMSLAIFLICGLSIFGIVYACMPKNDTITVQNLAWERNIETQIEKTFFENGWTLPAGARLRYTNEEFHHNDKVIDYYEDVEVTEYKYEKVGERTWTEYEENGDGTSDVIQCSEDIYENVPYTHTESQPVYKDVPVYQTKYYYDIDRWVHNRNLTTNGNDHNVYWSDESFLIGEREGKKSETYSIIAINEKEEVKTYTLDYSIWKDIEVGNTFNVKVHLGNRIEILDEEGNVIQSLE